MGDPSIKIMVIYLSWNSYKNNLKWYLLFCSSAIWDNLNYLDINKKISVLYELCILKIRH